MPKVTINLEACKVEKDILEHNAVVYVSGSTFSLIKGNEILGVSRVSTTYQVSSSIPCTEAFLRELKTTVHNSTGSANGHDFKPVGVFSSVSGTLITMNLFSGSSGTPLSAPATAITASLIMKYKIG